MSDTVKDKPWWVRADWWEPYHYDCVNDVPRSRWWPRRREVRGCDLPAGPVVRHPDHWISRRRVIGCVWVPVSGDHPVTGPPKWFRDNRWTNPQRRVVRDNGRRAVAEYRATGQVDVELPGGQHRHNALCDWH